MNDEVIDILSNVTIQDKIVKLNCGELERDTYTKVDEVLKRLWGKWNRRKGGHVFAYDPTDMIQSYIDTGKLPPKNETAYFPTPKVLVDKILEHIKNAIWWDDVKILEPSAGQGAFLDEIKEVYPEGDITCVEYLELNANILRKKGYNPIVDDFMDVEFEDKFDIIVMNPPFSLAHDRKAYITHIRKAHKLLKPDGVLFAIAPTGWINNSSTVENDFRKFVSIYSTDVELYDSGTFKEAGTLISTTGILLNSEESVSRHYGSGYYEDLFYYYLVGNMDREVSRQFNMEKSPESYFDFIMDYSHNKKMYVDGLPDGINKEECIKMIQQWDKEYEDC